MLDVIILGPKYGKSMHDILSTDIKVPINILLFYNKEPLK
jgi:hypothetical protein